MCESRHWNRIEAKKIEGDSFHILLTGMRSDNTIIRKRIMVAQKTDVGLRALPGLLDNLINEINEFESCRNGEF